MTKPGLSVLAVTNTYPAPSTPGDSPCIRDQLEALQAEGVRVDLLHIDRSAKLNYARAAWKLFKLSFGPKRYDLVHAYYGHCGLIARLQFRYPVVVTFRGSDLLGRTDGLIGRVVARLVQGVIVMSDEMQRVTGRERAHVIPFGVNTALFRPQPMAPARHALGLAADRRYVLFPWDPDRPEKRFDLVRDALTMLQRRYDNIEVITVFDQPHEVIAQYMNACDVLVLTSDHEGAPMAVREAAACNLPVVSVDVGDVRQTVGGMKGCFICEQRADDIAAKLGHVLDRNERGDGTDTVRRLDVAWSAERVLQVYASVLNSDHLASAI